MGPAPTPCSLLTSPALGPHSPPTTAPLPTAFSPRTPLCSLPPRCQVFALMPTHPGCHLWPPFQITAPIPGMPYPPSLLNVSPFLRSPSLHSVVHPTAHFVCVSPAPPQETTGQKCWHFPPRSIPTMKNGTRCATGTQQNYLENAE